MTYTFPQDFWWGAASSGPQHEGAASEGGREPSVWDKYYEMNPHRFFDGVGPHICGDFYHKYKEDIALLKELGLNSYRTSIQWTRLLPYGAEKANPDALRFYHGVIDALLEAGITPFVGLHHFDLPWSIHEKGGWENRETITAYCRFAETVYQHFADKVPYFFTFNEPIVVPYIAYLGGDALHPNVVDLHRGMTAAYNTALAHAEAVDAFRQGGYGSRLGIILNIAPSYARSEHPEDQKAARLADLFHNESFKEPVLRGRYSEELLRFMKDNKLPLAQNPEDTRTFERGVIDLLGINYYAPQRVKAKEALVNPKAPLSPASFFDLYEMPGRRINPYRGWEIYPQGIYDTLMNIKDNYGNVETFVSENGMGVENEERFRNSEGFIEDHYRIDFIKEHLRQVHRALEQGCRCKGYHLWTFADNWSWQNAYKNRYGYVEVQLHKGLKRVVKQSGRWIQQTARSHGFDN